MHIVGKIDKDMYKCITEDIRTDEVIITDERIEFVNDESLSADNEIYLFISR